MQISLNSLWYQGCCDLRFLKHNNCHLAIHKHSIINLRLLNVKGGTNFFLRLWHDLSRNETFLHLKHPLSSYLTSTWSRSLYTLID